MAKVRVRRAETRDDRAACLRLRWTVFVEEQGVSPSLERDEHDDPAAGAVHALAEIEAAPGRNVPAGAARCIFPATGTAKIQRMAVIDDARRRGVGKALLGFLEAEARARGAVRFVLDAQLSARGFYERLGYLAQGPIFLEAGIDHVRMEKAAP